LNILTLTSSYPRFAGDPTAPFVESISRHIAAQGHSIHMVLPESSAWNRPPTEGDIHYHPYRYSPRRAWTPWGYSESLEAGIKIRRRLLPLAPLVFLSATRACNSLASRESLDLIHAHWVVPNGSIAALSARRNRLPLVVSLHGSDITVSQRSRLLGKAARWTFSRADAVTAPSEDLLERAEQLGARGRLELITWGADPHAIRVDAARARSVRAQLGLSDEDIAVVGIGRFVRWKGFDDLIRAIARARASAASLRLVLVGDGDIADELKAQANDAGLGDDVIFAGMAAHDEIPGYLGAADIVVVPSVHYQGCVDGLPTVALEAMAAGRPLVATRVGGLPDVVRDGENGLLVDERDPAALAEAIVNLASEPELRHRMGDSGRALVETSLNWENVGLRFAEVYERAVKERRG
jgi:glycosyltransferase involved in cell wall biosynthesis